MEFEWGLLEGYLQVNRSLGTVVAIKDTSVPPILLFPGYEYTDNIENIENVLFKADWARVKTRWRSIYGKKVAFDTTNGLSISFGVRDYVFRSNFNCGHGESPWYFQEDMWRAFISTSLYERQCVTTTFDLLVIDDLLQPCGEVNVWKNVTNLTETFSNATFRVGTQNWGYHTLPTINLPQFPNVSIIDDGTCVFGEAKMYAHLDGVETLVTDLVLTSSIERGEKIFPSTNAVAMVVNPFEYRIQTVYAAEDLKSWTYKDHICYEQAMENEFFTYLYYYADWNDLFGALSPVPAKHLNPGTYIKKNGEWVRQENPIKFKIVMEVVDSEEDWGEDWEEGGE